MKTFATLCCAILLGLPAAAGHLRSFEEIREVNLPFSGAVDAETNGVGAITVKGWDNDYVLLRAHVNTSAWDEYQARLIAGMVQIDTSSDRVRVSGPAGKSWAVSYEIFAPRNSALRLKTRVGAISIADVTGAISAETSVGAIELTRVSGPVDAKTEVGAIKIKTPPASASVDLRTNLGAIKTDFPGARVEPDGFLARKLVIEGDGPRIHAETSIGQIDLLI
jgi:hypothetical protein